jgi:hypothetical protein
MSSIPFQARFNTVSAGIQRLFFFVFILLGISGPLWAGQAEYQWSVLVPSVTSEETQKAPRAFLWIPPDCERVRGVVLGQHNMLEAPLLEHPAFRQTLAELGFAAVWVSPFLGGASQFGVPVSAHFDEMLQRLSAESGYEALSQQSRSRVHGPSPQSPGQTVPSPAFPCFW